LAGIYIHIPFCKQACHYCNFHFSTLQARRTEMVQAILQEMDARRHYLGASAIETIYFGGGTPSLLPSEELERIFNRIYQLFPVREDAEITLEANPDDLTLDKIREMRNLPVNRFSIGIQSFSEEDLRFFNRAHNAIEARACIEYAQDAGYDNLTIDLIYGAPSTTLKQWERNLQIFFDYEIPHLSSYCLTVEPGTALAHFVKNQKVAPVDDDLAARQYKLLMVAMESEGYKHYEISNFALPGWYARHNSSYWTGQPYLGIGPSAHSYDGQGARQWNVANNGRYIRAWLGEDPNHQELRKKSVETEWLNERQRYNEYILTSLRTVWGCQLKHIPEAFRPHFLEYIQPFLQKGTVERSGDIFRLTSQGKLIADHITVELFLDEQ